MTVRQRIVDFLQKHPEGVDDDVLAEVLGLSQRQQANARCRQLESEGLVARRPVNGKIRNFWLNNTQPLYLQSVSFPDENNTLLQSGLKPWYWEGNVQAVVVQHLTSHHCLIRSVADTASRQRGKDIVAERNGKELWITVKGYPEGTPRTHPSTQAGHWFKQVVLMYLLTGAKVRASN